MNTSWRAVQERVLTPYTDPANGSSPLWCRGSTTLVRSGTDLFATVPFTDPSARPLCNTRATLYRSRAEGPWEQVWQFERTAEREPCPLVVLPDGRLLVTGNPAQRCRATDPQGRDAFTTLPQWWLFDPADPSQPVQTLTPRWDRDYTFTEHSYRGIACDAQTGYTLMTQQVPDGSGYAQAWTLWEPHAGWCGAGRLRFPMRGCYPLIALHGPQVHVVAVSDEVEPCQAWRQFKHQHTGVKWDYDFRQLYYTWTPDARDPDAGFSLPLTCASVDETCGLLVPLDLLLDEQGAAHVLYQRCNVWHDYVRDRFFPGLPMVLTLEYVRIQHGRVTARQTLLRADDGGEPWPALPGVPPIQRASVFPWRGQAVHSARWHVDPQRRRQVLLHYRAQGGEHWACCAVDADAPAAAPGPPGLEPLPLRQPLTLGFFTTSPRAGCAPSAQVDLMGINRDDQRVHHLALAR